MKYVTITCLFAVVFGIAVADASLNNPMFRIRRSGDHRLAELETLLGIAKQQTLSPSFREELALIGKRKRSANLEKEERYYPVDFVEGKYNPVFLRSISDLLTDRRKRANSRSG